MNKITLLFLFLSFAGIVHAQDDRRLLKGKVVAELVALEDIYVINRQTENTAMTEKGGYFSIMAKPGDTLMFSAMQIKGKLVPVSGENFSEALFFVKLEPMVHALDEVKIIRYDNINAVALGIIPQGQKKYTPAERRLKTASDGANQIGLSTVVAVDPLLNLLSGRTAMLKKEVDVEKKELLMKKIEDLFEEKFFVEQLKIPVLYVKGFWYFLVENDRLVAAINAKNRTMASFLMAELAVKYNDTIAADAK
jgi:hypothetical protein